MWNGVRADWVVAVAVIVVALVVTTALRWKSGSKRRFRITIVLERDYDGPKPDGAGGGQPGGDQPPPTMDQNDSPPPS